MLRPTLLNGSFLTVEEALRYAREVESTRYATRGQSWAVISKVALTEADSNLIRDVNAAFRRRGVVEGHVLGPLRTIVLKGGDVLCIRFVRRVQ